MTTLAKETTTKGWNFGEIMPQDIQMDNVIILRDNSDLYKDFVGRAHSGDIVNPNESSVVWKSGDKPVDFVAAKFIRSLRQSRMEGQDKTYHATVPYTPNFSEFLELPDGTILKQEETITFLVHFLKDVKEGKTQPTRVNFKTFSLKDARFIINNTVKICRKQKCPADQVYTLCTRIQEYKITKQGKSKSINFPVFSVGLSETNSTHDLAELALKTACEYVDNKILSASGEISPTKPALTT